MIGGIHFLYEKMWFTIIEPFIVRVRSTKKMESHTILTNSLSSKEVGAETAFFDTNNMDNVIIMFFSPLILALI